MGSIMMHILIGKRINEKYNFGNDFLIGCVLPDIYKTGPIGRVASHYTTTINDNNNIIDLPDLKGYIRKNNLYNPINAGYFCHLVGDYVWDKYFYGQFAKHHGVDENGEDLLTYVKENHSKIHQYNEFLQSVYNDFSIHDKKLYEMTGIEIEKYREDVRKYLNDSNYDKVVDSDIIVHKIMFPERSCEFISDDVLKRYINASIETFNIEYNKYKGKQ